MANIVKEVCRKVHKQKKHCPSPKNILKQGNRFPLSD